MDRYQWMIDTQNHFEADRPRMVANNKDLLWLGCALEGECIEFTHALLDYLSCPDCDSLKELSQELADITLYTLQMYRAINLDMFEEVREKRAFNTARFPSKEFSNGKTYGEAYTQSKEWVKQRRFKEMFYQ